MKKFDEKYCIEIFEKLLAVDSTTGFYEESQRQLCRLLEELGYPYETIRKGGVIADLGGEGDALCITEVVLRMLVGKDTDYIHCFD